MTRPVLRYRAKGPTVLELRKLLAARGFVVPGDGDRFNRDVRAVVQVYQSQAIGPHGHPLAVDGIVGPLTWWALTTANQELANVAGETWAPPVLEEGGTAIGRAALRAALQELEAGAQELEANNSGPFVAKYLDGWVQEGSNWCAAFVSWCVREGCLDLEVPMPIQYSLGARDTLHQLRDQGQSYQLGDRDPEPGDVVVWWRGKRAGWMGHIGLVHHAKDGVLWTVEGNRGAYPAPVRTYTYVLAGMDRLLGFGRLGD